MTILTDKLKVCVDEIPSFVPRCIARDELVKAIKDARMSLLNGPVCTITGNKCLTDTWNLHDPPNCSCGNLVRQQNELRDQLAELLQN